MTATTIPLHADGKIPSIGLGLWKIAKDEAPAVVHDAIRAGYRHLDSACDYGNEQETGQGIRAALRERLCKREDLWVTSKLWNTYHAREHVRPALERTLSDLGLDYLDLYLIHFPIAQKFVPFDDRYPPEWFYDPEAAEPRMEPASVPISETWQAMEEIQRAGLARHIGVSNFNCQLLRDLLSYCEIRPATLQIESHPYLTQEKLLRFCHEEAIVPVAFSPFGAQSYFSLGMANESEAVMEQPIVVDIASRHGKSPAQVLLRWGVQRGTAVIPKSSNPTRLRENLDIFDFELTDDEMSAISALNCDRRFNDPGEFCEGAFNRFFPIYE
ncbi:MAG: aldo/keto reductase [Pirellulales bacterium]|nr:aldo/keto reductase [Pirellulales bacterium]